ncbi:hypothetical protein [Okeania sp. SIO2B3]|nr:hypothetical protein [Okeania sp. SIO2B3]
MMLIDLNTCVVIMGNNIRHLQKRGNRQQATGNRDRELIIYG